MKRGEGFGDAEAGKERTGGAPARPDHQIPVWAPPSMTSA